VLLLSMTELIGMPVIEADLQSGSTVDKIFLGWDVHHPVTPVLFLLSCVVVVGKLRDLKHPRYLPHVLAG
jgi:hypothetical protein